MASEEGEGRRCFRGWSRDSPTVPGENHGEILSPMDVTDGADIHLQPVDGQMGVPEGGCDPRVQHCCVLEQVP